jgi:molecular chaperone DnaK (HSP70)
VRISGPVTGLGPDPFPDPIFGLDLGASKVCVAAMDGRGVPTVLADPAGRTVIDAVLSFAADGTVLVGPDAVPQRLKDPRHTVFGMARMLGLPASSREVLEAAARMPFALRVGPDDRPLIATRAGELSVVDTTGFLLEHARRYAQLATGSDGKRVVLTAPVMYGTAQRAALTTAATMAGFEVEAIVDAPIAYGASWAYGRAVPPLTLVYDFGAGKLECSVIELVAPHPRLLGSAADSLISGDELDERIVDTLVRAFWQVHQVDLRSDPLVPLLLRREAEAAKRLLSAMPEAHIRAIAVARSRTGTPIDLDLSLSRETLANTVADLTRRSFAVADAARRRTGVRAGALDEAIMVGGVTRLPFVREALAAHLGRMPRTDVPWEEGAALGAAIWGAHGGGLPDPKAPGLAKRITSNFGSHTQQAKPSEARTAFPTPGRVGRVHTKRMFTVTGLEGGLSDVRFSPATPLPVVDDAETRRDLPAYDDPAGTRRGAAPAGEARPSTHTTATAGMPPIGSVRPQVVEVLASRLALSTVGGYCDEIIARDTPLPHSRTRKFTTGKDGQRLVSIQVCQGDSRRFDENRALGVLVLADLPPRPRGVVAIEVTFAIDADGVLHASARDAATGQAQSLEIRLGD